MKMNWKALLISLAISLGVGALSALVTSDSMMQYDNMYKPPLSPPAWLFPIVWTILFTLMGIAAYLIYVSETEKEKKSAALRIYAIQLAINALWTIIFFNLEAYILAFAWLLLLWYLIFLTIKAFNEINTTAARLLIPYLLWVTFAGYLTLAIALNS